MAQLVVVPELEPELDRLFELQPSEFVAARNDLAGRLKQAGQSEAAARIQALRKPTIPVWTVNQLARRRLDAIEALIAASDELRAAQEAALAGGGGAELRAATTAEREAMRTITESAHELLSAGDQRPTAAMLERVASTLRTAARDPRGRELLVAGTLADELEAAGFDALEGMRLPARRKPARRGGMQAGAAEERRREERLRKLRQKAEKLGAAAEDAEREAEKAEAEAARKRREAERAAAAAERAHSELGAAERTKPA